MTQFEQLQQINSTGKTSPMKKGLYLGKVVNLKGLLPGQVRSPFDFYLPLNDRSSHFGCMGTTGTGKTYLIRCIIEQDILAGHSVVVIDPKGDDKLCGAIVSAAAKAGRLHELMLINPIFPQFSLKIDPLAYSYLTDERVEHVISGIKAKEEYFINIAQEVTSAIVGGLEAMQKASQNSSIKINFNEIKKWTSYHSLKQFAESLKYLQDHPDENVRYLAEETIASIEQILTSPVEFFSKVSSSLRTVLSALSTSTTGKIIGRATQNEFVKKFEQGERVILLFQTGSMLTRRTSQIMSKVLLSMIQSMVGRFYASQRKINPPLSIHLDEGHNSIYKGVQELFNKARGANVWLHFYTQSISQMIEEVGKEVTQSILDNINTFLFMRVNHEETAAYVEESTPLKKYQQSIISMSAGKLSISLRENEQRTVLKEKVLALPNQWYYLRHSGNIYKGKVPTLPDTDVTVKTPKIEVISGK